MEESSQEKNRLHSMVVLIISALCLGAIIENIAMGWEFWMPPLIGVGILAMWWMHIVQYNRTSYRENFYLIFSMVVTFYHGVHSSSFFDVVIVCSLLMGAASLLGRKTILKLVLIEFYAVMAVQISLAIRYSYYQFNGLLVSRLILHLVAAYFLYLMLSKLVEQNQEKRSEIDELCKEKASNDTDMEDFLVNISHELRTPLNVINGLTDLILRKEPKEKIIQIRNAGLRMAGQIEDIQDYSEIRQNNLTLENSRYMVTSIVHDILANYNAMHVKPHLEFIVDIDPTVPAALKGDIRKIQKIIAHLLDNAFKFTNEGGAYLRLSALKKEYGVNLIIEVTDTGIGMTEKDIESVQKGVYQANMSRTRSTGGIGLGLSIVYGVVRAMNGFVRIESQRGKGTTVRVSIYQEVIDPSPCLGISTDKFINIVFYDCGDKQRAPEIDEMYRNMGKNLAAGLRVNLYFASSLDDLKKLVSKGKITHIFMEYRDYAKDKSYIRNLADGKITVTMICDNESQYVTGSNIVCTTKPFHALTIVQILNGNIEGAADVFTKEFKKPELSGIKALVVDDEQMNLVVARGLFGEYKMSVDTAESGKEAIEMYSRGDYDVVFMDHMMPGMDGIEAMKFLRGIADRDNRKLRVIALTANAVSGAKEMFIREGFDGFIAKPINIGEFERVMNRVMADKKGQL